MSAIHPWAAELYRLANELNVASTRTVVRDASGLIDRIEERRPDPIALIAQGLAFAKSIETSGERVTDKPVDRAAA